MSAADLGFVASIVAALAFAYFLGWRMALAHVVRAMENRPPRPFLDEDIARTLDVEATRRNDVPRWHPKAGRE